MDFDEVTEVMPKERVDALCDECFWEDFLPFELSPEELEEVVDDG